ncbi:MAG: DUF5908 family protein [Candidatus Competibacteraceae bacterium]
MPIIVDEVVIAVEVTNQAAGGAGAGPTSTAAAGPVSTDEKQALINECVERVLEILEQKTER